MSRPATPLWLRSIRPIVARHSTSRASFASMQQAAAILRRFVGHARAMTPAKAFAECGVSGQMAVRKAKDGHVFVTDGGHWIVDAHLGRIEDAPRLAGLLGAIPGVVEHGLFIGLASTAILAGAQGIRVVERQ